jgi:hypothetical protein
MRIPRFLVVLLLFTATRAGAQDLQFRMRMNTTVAGQPAAATSMPETTVMLKGKKVRIDNKMRGPTGQMNASILMDDAAGKFFMMLHDEKVYMEMPNPAGSLQRLQDSIAQRGPNKTQPKLTRTGEHKKIAGYDAERVVIGMPLPGGFPGMGSDPVYTVTDMWIATDAALNKAYRPFAERSARYASPTLPGAETLMAQITGFPLQSTHVIVRMRSGKTPDALALLKSEKPEGLMMRVVTVAEDIKMGALAPTLFKVPAGYTLQQR